MPNMQQLISRLSRKIADGPADEIWNSKLDLDYANGQLLLSKEARYMYICRKRGKLYRLLPFPKRILRIGVHTDHFSRKNRPNTGE